MWIDASDSRLKPLLRGSAGRGTGLFETQLLELAVDRAFADAERFGDFLAVAVVALEQLLDVLGLDVF